MASGTPERSSLRLTVSVAPKLISYYSPPAVRKGDRVTCLYRDCECVITGFHDGRIVWPRVRSRECRSGSGLWVNDELVRAIQTEIAAALSYWFGVSKKTVCFWRRAFEVKGKFGTPGSEKAHLKASRKGAKAVKGKEWTVEEREKKRKLSKRLGLQPGPRWTQEAGGWTPEELALLGTNYDEAIARKIGRTVSAVRIQRRNRKVKAFRDRRRRGEEVG